MAVYYWYHPVSETQQSFFLSLFPSTEPSQRARAFFLFPPFFLPLYTTTMELLSKPLQAAADLDTARCKGQWQSIPVLADRYKKYHPDESGTYIVYICMCTDNHLTSDSLLVLEATARLEAEFSILLSKKRKQPINNALPAVTNRSTTHLVPPTSASSSSHDTADMYENDTPNHITLPDPLDVAMTEPILKKLLMIIQQHQGGGGPGQEPETNDQWQAQVR